MAAIAAKLSDAQMKALAEYTHRPALRPLVLPPVPATGAAPRRQLSGAHMITASGP